GSNVIPHACASRCAESDQGATRAPWRSCVDRDYFGCPTVRKYGLYVLKPAGYFLRASSSETDVGMMTSSPGFQFAGVARPCFALTCNASTRRSTSSKLRPALIG